MQVGDPISEEIIIRARESFARQGLMAHLGAAITEVRAGIVKLRLPFRPELTQQHAVGGTAAEHGVASAGKLHDCKNLLIHVGILCFPGLIKRRCRR